MVLHNFRKDNKIKTTACSPKVTKVISFLYDKLIKAVHNFLYQLLNHVCVPTSKFNTEHKCWVKINLRKFYTRLPNDVVHRTADEG